MFNYKNYQLVLLDFDGLLVNTEQLHFQSYIHVLKEYGFDLDWSFERYCLAAHYDNTLFQKKLFEQFPDLQKIGWTHLYEKKKNKLLSMYEEGAIHLMPGVDQFLKLLAKEGINRCVVTHSPKILIDALKNKIESLNTIPHWITREDYSHPKPHPECYVHAIHQHAKQGDKIVGFEDTPRGLRALMHTPAQPVWICQTQYPELEEFQKKGVIHFETFNSIINPDQK
jgi:HAD superfamily hydrolase (TIGR01509 family)